MKRSQHVALSLVSTLASAALAAGCGSNPPSAPQEGWQTCVDRGWGVAVEQQYCDDEQRRPHASGYVPLYHWYYFPRGPFSGAPALGMPVPSGGAYRATPLTSVRTAHPGSVARGGFGSTAAGHASAGE